MNGMMRIAGLIVLLLANPAQAVDIWWPKQGDEALYDLYAQGTKVGTAKLTFSEKDGQLVAVLDNRVKFDLGSLAMVGRVVFREYWDGDTLMKMTSHGQAKVATESRRYSLSAERQPDNSFTFNSSYFGERTGGEYYMPATFWHLTHILSPDIFDPFVGGFANLEFENLGPQKIKADGGERECLAFTLKTTFKDRDNIGELPPGVNREDIPLSQTGKAWFDPDGLMCALLTQTPFGTLAMERRYRKTD